MDTHQPLITLIFGDTANDFIINGALISIFAIIIFRTILKPLIDLMVNIYLMFKRERLIALEITPPINPSADPNATQHLISILSERMGKYERITLEITSSRAGGVRYRLVAQEWQIESLQKYFATYIPELKFTFMHAESIPKISVFTIAQMRHFAYPLKPSMNPAKVDPIEFMTGSMTKLAENEEVTLQLVLRRHSLKKSMKIYNELLNTGSAMITDRFLHFIQAYSWILVLSLIIGGLAQSWEIGISLAIVLWASSLFTRKQTRIPTNLEAELFSDIASKLELPLLRTDIRLAIRSPWRTESLVHDFTSSLQPLNTTGFQRLGIRRLRLGKRFQRYCTLLFNKRLSSILTFNSSLLSTNEIASLFHFPYGGAHTDGMVRSHSRVLPAPISLRARSKYSVSIGNNNYHNTVTPIGLTETERERHVYIIGGTGNGKTTMLQYAIVQDIKNGKGLAVIDPHGDLAETILRHIPEERIEDVIYMNPDDLAHPIGMNLLELPEGLSEDDLLREKDLVTESVISVMRKLFSDDDSGGHRVEYVLRNAIQTALTLEHPTLFTIFDLLNDPTFRRSAIKTLQDENLKKFWNNELGKAGGFQQVKMVAGITAKIGRFLFSASAKRILEQEKSTIDFDAILDGKILICNFSKGILGEDTSTLFGTTVLTKLQLASLRRARKNTESRRPFYLYVDEFQNFATIGFVQMLSEARKYKLFLTMAEQSTSQQEQQRLTDVILANVGTVVCFRSGNPADERLVLPLFSPYIEPGEIANLPAYTFYARISAVHAQEPMSGVTIVLSDSGSERSARLVVESSREHYAKQAAITPPVVSIKKQTSSTKRRRTTTKTQTRSFTPKIIDTIDEIQ